MGKNEKDFSARIPWKWPIGAYIICFVALSAMWPFMDFDNAPNADLDRQLEELKAENTQLRQLAVELGQGEIQILRDTDTGQKYLVRFTREGEKIRITEARPAFGVVDKTQ